LIQVPDLIKTIDL